MKHKPGGEGGVISPIAAMPLSLALLGACATTHGPRRLTVQALEQVKAACRAPDARLSIDEHVSIVFPNDTPDRRRQIHCLHEQIRARGYWIDQIVTEHANDAGF